MKRLFLNILAIFVITTAGKFWLNAFGSNGSLYDSPQSSIAASRSNGVYVCSVQATPKTFQLNGTTITLEDVWIEQQVRTDHPYVWGSRTTPSKIFYLCFTVSPRDFFQDSASPSFVCDGRDSGGNYESMSCSNGSVFSTFLEPEALTKHETNLRLVKDLNDRNSIPAVSIKLTW